MDYHIIRQAVLEGDEDIALEQTQALLAQGVAPLDIINDGLIAAMGEVGRLFKEGELFVPEVMMAAATVAAAVDTLKPLMEDARGHKGTVVLGTVKGDLHDIGKNLVALLLSSNGFEVVDLGADVPPQAFYEAAVQHQAKLVGLSALLTTTMPQMSQTIQYFAAQGARAQVKIVIGGAPVSAAYAAEIGADGYAENAMEAVDLCETLLGLR